MSEAILAQILARLTAIEAGQTALLDLINAGNERVLTSIDEIREDLTVLGGANDHARRLGDNTREELRSLADLVAAIQRTQLKQPAGRYRAADTVSESDDLFARRDDRFGALRRQILDHLDRRLPACRCTSAGSASWRSRRHERAAARLPRPARPRSLAGALAAGRVLGRRHPNRFCKDCRWAEGPGDPAPLGLGKYASCTHPGSRRVGVVNPVTGRQGSPHKLSCELARAFRQRYCGPEGRFWEPVAVGLTPG